MEEWNGGTLEYWVEKKIFSLLNIIPTFHYSRIIHNRWLISFLQLRYDDGAAFFYCGKFPYFFSERGRPSPPFENPCQHPGVQIRNFHPFSSGPDELIQCLSIRISLQRILLFYLDLNFGDMVTPVDSL